MRAATILSVAALLCALGARADEGPADLGHAPHLISTALRKMAKGVQKILKRGAPHGNATGGPVFQVFTIPNPEWPAPMPTQDGATRASQTLSQIEQGIDEVAMDIEDWVSNVSRHDKASKESNARSAKLSRDEVLKLKHATARVRNASDMRSAPKAAEIARLQKIKDQLNAEIRARTPTPKPKMPIESGNIHAFEKYLSAPRRDEEPTPKPTAPPPPVAVKQNLSQVKNITKMHAPITSKDVADEVMRKQKEEKKEQSQKAEEIAEAARNASLRSLQHKKVKMSRKLRGYLRMPTPPPPMKTEKRNKEKKDVHVSAGRKHLLAAQNILARMNESQPIWEEDKGNGSIPSLVAPVENPPPAEKPAAHPAPLAPNKTAVSALQLSKFWAIPKDSTNVWPWVKGGVHM